MKEEKGYEILDAKAECRDQHREKMNRLNRVEGYPPDEHVMEEYGNTLGGFIKRNNVKERL